MEPVTRLGKHETTVLTNRSNFITIVSDLPFKHRRNSDAQHFSNAFTQNGTYQKGSRPFHRTTLCFEDKPQKIEYLTTTHQAFSGKKDLSRGHRPTKCQSLHHSNFSIGTSQQLDLETQTMNSFGKKQLIPASRLHEDRVRWNDHVFTGQQMDKSLRQVGFGKVDHITTYENVHNELGRKLSSGATRRVKQPNDKFNIISGQYIGKEEPRCLRLCSGNRILQKIRKETTESLLG